MLLDIITILSIGLISIGAIFLMISVFKALSIWRITPENIKKKWLILILLICFFCIGYFFVLCIIIFNISFPLIVIMGSVFFGGAMFVFIIISF